MRLLTKQKKGSALLTALFIMTLVAIVATAMTTRLQLDIYRTKLIVIHDKLFMASQAINFWSLTELNNQNNKFTKADAHGMVALFPAKLEHIYPQVTLTGGLYDLQSRYNLNNIVDKKWFALFLNLIKNSAPNINDKASNNLAYGIKDWLTDYELSKGKDSYTSYYLSQNPPYYPSHQPMLSSSELRLVKDVTADQFLAIEPFVTVLPDSTAINLNTASKELLMSLGNGITEVQANEIIMSRGEEGIKKISEINELLNKLDLPQEQITLESTYFLSVAIASSEDFKMVVYTLYQRSKNDENKLIVSIMRQSINGF